MLNTECALAEIGGYYGPPRCALRLLRSPCPPPECCFAAHASVSHGFARYECFDRSGKERGTLPKKQKRRTPEIRRSQMFCPCQVAASALWRLAAAKMVIRSGFDCAGSFPGVHLRGGGYCPQDVDGAEGNLAILPEKNMGCCVLARDAFAPFGARPPFPAEVTAESGEVTPQMTGSVIE